MLLKNRNISSTIKRSKVTDYAALKSVLSLAVISLGGAVPFRKIYGRGPY